MEPAALDDDLQCAIGLRRVALGGAVARAGWPRRPFHARLAAMPLTPNLTTIRTAQTQPGQNRQGIVGCLLLAVWLFCTPSTPTASPPAIDKPLTTRPGNPDNGRRIVLDRATSACLLCHSGPFSAPHLQGSIGPSLTGVGSRLSPGEIRLRLVDPARFNPDTVMPAYYVTTGLTRVGQPWQGKPVLTAEQIEDVVTFLTTLREP